MTIISQKWNLLQNSCSTDRDRGGNRLFLNLKEKDLKMEIDEKKRVQELADTVLRKVFFVRVMSVL